MNEPDLLPAVQPQRTGMSPMEILAGMREHGVTAENVSLAKELADMVRQERTEQARAAFYRAFAALRREMPVIYADKEVKTRSGDVAFAYCTPGEIKDILEPLLQRHGFTTMAGQQLHDGVVTVNISLMHEEGHCETREFSVRVSPGNALTTPTQQDAGATTAAERHLLIKMFGLRTRLREDDDPRALGERVTPEQALELEARLKQVNGNVDGFLKVAGAKTFDAIPSTRYALLDEMLAKKERAQR